MVNIQWLAQRPAPFLKMGTMWFMKRPPTAQWIRMKLVSKGDLTFANFFPLPILLYSLPRGFFETLSSKSHVLKLLPQALLLDVPQKSVNSGFPSHICTVTLTRCGLPFLHRPPVLSPSLLYPALSEPSP
jgi:hypothetical protein